MDTEEVHLNQVGTVEARRAKKTQCNENMCTFLIPFTTHHFVIEQIQKCFHFLLNIFDQQSMRVDMQVIWKMYLALVYVCVVHGMGASIMWKAATRPASILPDVSPARSSGR